MTTTDLKSGDVVRHPEHGYGIVLYNSPKRLLVGYAAEDGRYSTAFQLTGWERVETCTAMERRILDVLDDQQGREGDVEIGGFVCEDATRREERLEREGKLPGTLPLKTEVVVGCPQCGGEVRAWVEAVRTFGPGQRWSLHWADRNLNAVHECPKETVPEEPTERGSKVTISNVNGIGYQLLRAVGPGEVMELGGAWADQEGGVWSWSDILKYGLVTLGWDD